MARAQSDTPSRGSEEDDARRRALLLPEFCTVPALTVLMLVGELVVVVLVLAGPQPGWQSFALTSLFVQWVVLASAGVLCVLRPVVKALPLPRGAALSFAVITGVCAAVSVLAQWLMRDDAVGGPAIDPMRVGSHVVTCAIIAGMVLRYFYVQQRLRNQEQSALHARIQALQSRIRPHFLFNSMNIIASLIAIEPETAETVVEDLSELFRASLNDAGNQVPLDEELALCERYIRIEGLRLGERLKVEWDVADVPEGIQIPLLTLQPLLENAIYHGIQPLPEGGTVRVSIRHVNGVVTIRVDNPIPPPSYRDGSHTQGNRMAIANIRSRLNVLYGDDAQLVTETTEDQYITTLAYPFAASGKGTEE